MSLSTKTLSLRLRPMTEADLECVLAVEEAAYAFPWSRQIFSDCLKVDYSCWVGELSAAIVAHAVMGIAVGECQIFNLCVHPQWQGRGIGRSLLHHLLQVARQHGAKTAFLEVRVSNSIALALYRSEGFCEMALRRGYYPAAQGREDAMVMALELTGSPSVPSLLTEEEGGKGQTYP
ncbi:ribosomal protein S18-alanine N-acetyltransferase [Caldichromatium japonicum]|uniref:[Ribosomal protein bS18]-alanine N-acetyltransferase n=1 Tax=Caldichromatium japonicum TaxID=2699430 RepID=A0A6G7V9W1_9GAMM|nr:ribosomal protein S18-alanine N-acetyltransferase [Caldichromatium japonicum]QIK36849.1 ribosomal protein S18-alanine N-acetyltransferase [Caldichromatium japonicum]